MVDNRGRLIAHSDPTRPLAEDLSGVEIVRIFLDQSLNAQSTGDDRLLTGLAWHFALPASFFAAALILLLAHLATV